MREGPSGAFTSRGLQGRTVSARGRPTGARGGAEGARPARGRLVSARGRPIGARGGAEGAAVPVRPGVGTDAPPVPAASSRDAALVLGKSRPPGEPGTGIAPVPRGNAGPDPNAASVLRPWDPHPAQRGKSCSALHNARGDRPAASRDEHPPH